MRRWQSFDAFQNCMHAPIVVHAKIGTGPRIDMPYLNLVVGSRGIVQPHMQVKKVTSGPPPPAGFGLSLVRVIRFETESETILTHIVCFPTPCADEHAVV